MSDAATSDALKVIPIRRSKRWHILVFLFPAFVVYTAIMILPLIETLRL